MIGGLAVLILCAGSCVVIVDETEYAVVTDFGKVVAVYGDRAGGGGSALQASLAGRACGVDRRLRTSTRRRAR